MEPPLEKPKTSFLPWKNRTQIRAAEVKNVPLTQWNYKIMTAVMLYNNKNANTLVVIHNDYCDTVPCLWTCTSDQKREVNSGELGNAVTWYWMQSTFSCCKFPRWSDTPTENNCHGQDTAEHSLPRGICKTQTKYEYRQQGHGGESQQYCLAASCPRGNCLLLLQTAGSISILWGLTTVDSLWSK